MFSSSVFTFRFHIVTQYVDTDFHNLLCYHCFKARTDFAFTTKYHKSALVQSFCIIALNYFPSLCYNSFLLTTIIYIHVNNKKWHLY